MRITDSQVADYKGTFGGTPIAHTMGRGCSMAAIGSNLESFAGRYMDGRTNQRACSRTLVVAPCVLLFRNTRHVGLIRDISSNGLFAYSDFQPAVGDTVRVLISERNDATKTAACTGVVVRVESKAAGAATGIAVRFSSYELL